MMNRLKKIAKYSTITLISSLVVTLLLIKTLSLVLKDGQKTSLFGYGNATINSIKKESNNTILSKNNAKTQPIVPKSIAINHDKYPTLSDLKNYLWWSEKSLQFVQFTEKYRQEYQNSEIDEQKNIISQIPYSVKGSLIYYDFSEFENPMNIEEHTSMSMSWQGNTLIFTPNDNHENKEERSNILIPVKQMK